MNELSNIGLTMSSREIAELAGKQHKNVLVDCDKLNESYANMGMADISAVNYKAENGREYREYLLTRMQTFDLMTGYNLTLRIKVNRRWEELEKRALQERPAVPTSTLDILKLAIQGLEEQQKGLDEVKKEVRELKAATKTTPDYFAIMGYASLNKIQIGLTLAASLGRKAKRICETHGYPIESIPDPRFGRVHTYPYSVLERVFNESVV